MTYSRNAIALVVAIFSLFGFEVGEDTIVEVIGAIGLLWSFYNLIKNQVTRKDVYGFFFKKDTVV